VESPLHNITTFSYDIYKSKRNIQSPNKFSNIWNWISLISYLYKIISKALAERQKKVFPMIIHEDQTTFIDGGQILDTIMIASESVDK